MKIISFLEWAGLEVFTMKRIAFRLLMLTPLLLALVVLPARRAAADDETDELEVKVQATIDLNGVNCSTPPTISVLGLIIDISNASINRNVDEDIEDSGDLTCADLADGQMVEVKLATDLTTGELVIPLSATEVDIGGGECEDDICDALKIAAPLQTIDTSVPDVPKVTVLGLVVDISQASLEGADDGDTEGDNQEGDIEGGNQPVDVSQLLVGQFVELTLDSSTPPLVANTLEVKNFTNQIDVDVIDEDGNQVDDGDVNDVEVDVQVTAKVNAPPAPHSVRAAVAPKRVKKVLKFNTTSNGSFTLYGLPTGRAKIVVTRIHNGHTSAAKRLVNVNSNRTKYLHIRLKPLR